MEKTTTEKIMETPVGELLDSGVSKKAIRAVAKKEIRKQIEKSMSFAKYRVRLADPVPKKLVLSEKVSLNYVTKNGKPRNWFYGAEIVAMRNAIPMFDRFYQVEKIVGAKNG